MKNWKITIARDTTVRSLGFHGLHVAFNGLPNVEVTGFFDGRAEDLEKVMAATGAKRHYRDYLQMLDTEQPDIVVLCSRHPYDHFAQIKAAAERGIHIYCEKPLTVSLKEADAIVELVERNNIKLCMAHPARYNAAFLQMRKMVGNGEIGRPLTIYGRGKSDHRGGGEDLMTLGTHVLDLQTFFFGEPESVWAEVMFEGKPVGRGDTRETVEPIGPTAGDDIFAAFRFPDGVRALFESRRDIVDWKKQETQMGIAVIGTEGTLSLRFDDRYEASLRMSRLPSPPDADACFEKVEVVDERSIPGAAPLDYSLRSVQTPPALMFLEGNRFAAWDLMCSIEENRRPLSNMYNARLALEMIYGIYASQVTRRMIDFPLTDRNHPLDD
jgi:predicted dehydrogenase